MDGRRKSQKQIFLFEWMNGTPNEPHVSGFYTEPKITSSYSSKTLLGLHNAVDNIKIPVEQKGNIFKLQVHHR